MNKSTLAAILALVFAGSAIFSQDDGVTTKYYQFDFDFFRKLGPIYFEKNPDVPKYTRINPRGLIEAGGIILDKGDGFIHLIGTKHHHLVYRDTPDKHRALEALYLDLMGEPIIKGSMEQYENDRRNRSEQGEAFKPGPF